MLESWLAHGKVTQQLGAREIQGRKATGLRISFGDRQADIWIDLQTRQIVRALEPTTAVYDPDNDRALRTPVPKNVRGGMALKGGEWTDIIYEPPADGVKFVLQPPEGYKVEHIKSRLPTEKDLIEWLEVFAQVRGGTFCDNEGSPFSKSEEAQARLKSPPANPSKWDEIFDRGYIQKEDVPLYGSGYSVVVVFRSRIAEEGTWHYQGKDVKLGDAQTPICWYRLPGATAYRIVYGNLDVKDVEEKNLPAKR
ncbi:MAG: hypothetical protein V4719_12960 [Planctomycetota bacterium]